MRTASHGLYIASNILTLWRSNRLMLFAVKIVFVYVFSSWWLLVRILKFKIVADLNVFQSWWKSCKRCIISHRTLVNRLKCLKNDLFYLNSRSERMCYSDLKSIVVLSSAFPSHNYCCFLIAIGNELSFASNLEAKKDNSIGKSSCCLFMSTQSIMRSSP